MTMRLFDTHSHLQSKEFDHDRDRVLDRAWEAGLDGLVVLGTDVESSEAAIAMAEGDERVLATAGFHPHDAKAMDDRAFDRIAGLVRHPRVVAVGEIGLDFYRNLSPHDVQVAVLERHLDLAARVGKPVAVHGRDARDTLFSLLEAWSQRLGAALPGGRPLGVLHYFTDDAELGRRYVDLGFYISIHTSVTHPKSEQLRQVARELPLDRLVVETDSPYGAPQSQRGRRNEPALVAEAVLEIARVRGEDAEHIAAQTTDNARRLFGLDIVAAAATGAVPAGKDA